MRPRAFPRPIQQRGLVALVAGLALLAGPASTAPSASDDVAGTWSGSARLRTEGPPVCEYVSAAGAAGVTLQITHAGNRYRGTVSLDLPAPGGSTCPPLRARQDVEDVTVSGTSVGFRDPSGHEWNLGVRGGALQGLVAWKPEGGVSSVAMPKLAGEVALAKVSSEGAGKAARSGSGFGGVAAILAANVVGVGAFAGVNVLANDSGQSGGTATCSPRSCFFAALTDPCTCTIDVVSGSSCPAGGGAPAGASCGLPSVPCQAGLSCNNGICEDRGGRCPF